MRFDDSQGPQSQQFDGAGAPRAASNVNSVNEGSSVSVAPSGVLANDVAGPDGFAAGGGVVGVRAAGGDVESASTTGVGSEVAGIFGTLVLNADGSYTYSSTPGAVPEAGASDVFVYTIRDGSGDQATTTLTIRLGDSGMARAQLVPGADGVVLLPAGVELDDIRVVGRDLIVTLPDGSQMIIIDGAIDVPQLVLNNNVLIPSDILIAQLISEGLPIPANIVRPLGSGGNFAVEVDGIGDAADLGDLLPPTDLTFPVFEFQEEPRPFLDDEPDVIVITPNNPAGAATASATVNESGLPARGAESAGSNAAAATETTTGTIAITSGDPPFTVTLNGVAVTAVNQVFTTPAGALTITSIATNAIGYSYTLADNTSGDATSDVFAVVLTDNDGDTSLANLTINIVDDVPTARNDADEVLPGATTASGNVITGSGTTAGTANADTFGADGATMTGVRVGSAGAFTAIGGGVTINGQFGTLNISANGNYTYTKTAAAAGGTDVFSYQLTDGDGDTSTATLTISLPDNPVSLTVPTVGAGTSVSEVGLPARPGEPAGTNEPSNLETTSGTITYSAPDAPATIRIGGTIVTGPGQVIAVTNGTITIDSLTTTSLGYTFTLTDNIAADPASISIPVSVTDSDGDVASANLVIAVADDAPNAIDDAAQSVAEDAVGTIGGNVLANDIQGADGATVTSVTIGATTTAVAAAGTTTIPTANGTYTINAAGAWTFDPNPGLNNAAGIDASFSYTITDGDGDVDTAVQPINVTDGAGPTGPRGAITLSLDDQNLANGSTPAGPDSDSDTITFTPGSDPIASIVFAASTAGLTGGLTWTRDSDTQITGKDGADTIVTLTLGVVGNVATVTATLSNNYDSHPGLNADDLQSLGSVGVVATDIDGSSVTGTVNVEVSDDVPDAIDDAAQSVAEDAAAPIGGNVLANDIQGADDATLTSVTIGATTTAIAAVGTTPVVTANGTYTFTAAGAWTFDPNSGLNNPQGVDASFSYTITDGDGDTDTAVQPITVTDGAAPSAGAAITLSLDDQNLANGSTPAGPDFDADTITFTPGSDPIASIVFAASTAGLTGGLTWTRDSDTQITGKDGADTIVTLTLGVVGNVATVTATLSNNYDSHPGLNADDLQSLGSVGVVATDTDGSSVTGIVNVEVSDDVPDAIDDAAQSVAEDGPSIGGNVLANDVQGADDATLTSVTIGGVTTAVAAVGPTQVVTANGTYAFTSTGAWDFDPNPGLNNAGGVDASFSYTITDGDGDTDTAVQPITVTDGAGPTGPRGAITLSLDDQNLANGSTPAGPDFDADTITFTPGSDPIASIVFAASTAGLTGGLTWTRDSDTQITGKDGADTIVTLTLGVVGNVATVTATLSNNYDSHPGLADDLQSLGSVGVVATDIDGSSVTGTVNVEVSDDVPDAIDDTLQSVAEDAPGTIGGNVLANDVQGADDATLTHVDLGAGMVAIGSGAPQGGGVFSFATANGTYTFAASGAWTFDPNTGLVSPTNAGFSYRITDGDGDTDTAVQPITVTDGAAPTAGAPITLTVDDQNLANGSTPAGPDFDADTITFTPGSDPIASIVFAASTAGLTGGLTWTRDSDTQITGKDGADTIVTLTLGVVGNVATVTATLSNNYDSHPGLADDLQSLGSVGVVATDIDGSSVTGTVNVEVSDDVPDAIDDTLQSVAEDAPGTIGGNVLANDVQGADDATLTHVDLGAGMVAITSGAPQGGGVFSFATANGTYTFAASGAWTFDPNTGLVSPTNAGFSYRITDGDGDTDTAVQPITVTDGAAPTAGAPITLTVDDQNLANGSTPAGPDFDADTITFTPGSDPIASIVFAASTAGLTGGLTWTRDSDTQITGKDGADTIVTLTLGVVGNVATVTATLSNNYDSHPGLADDLQSLGSVGVVATDIDGSSVTGTVNVEVSDDVPDAIDDTLQSVAEDAPGTIGGNVLANDVQGADDATLTHVDLGAGMVAIGSGAPQGGGVFSFATANGTYTFAASGAWTFDPNTGLVSPTNAGFSYRITDGDGDTDTAVQPITVTDGAAPTAGAPITLTVDDQNLANGSTPAGPDFDADTITFTPGSDPIASIVFAASTAGLTGGLTWTRDSDTQITGKDGADTIVTLTLGVVGNVATVTATLSNNYDSHPGLADDLQSLGSVGVVATDIDGSSVTGTVNVEVSDDVPDAIDDTLQSVAEDAPGTIGGNVLANDVQGADDATLTHVDLGAGMVAITSGAPQGGGVFSFATANGTYTFAASGAWTFDPNPGLVSPTNAGFSYRITDGDGDTDTASQPITVTDGAAPTAGAPITLTVDDQNLANGSTPAGPDFDADTITFTPGSDPIASIVFAASTAGLTGGLTWTRDSDTQITGKDGADTIVTLTLGVVGNVATVTATLSNNYDSHPTINVDDLQSLGSVGVVATDIDGSSVTGTVNVEVSDDVPDAIDDTLQSVAEDAPGTIGGNVLANDVQGADDATLTHVDLGAGMVAIGSGAPQGGGVFSFATANGTYTFAASGAWTFDPNTGLVSPTNAGFSYRITDGDGDTDTASQPITVTDGAAPTAGAPITLTVDDQNLANGSTPAGPDFDADTITFTPGSDPIASIVFAASTAGLTGGLTWTRDSDTQITGKDGADTIVTLTLGVVGNVATVTATLSNNYDSHPTINVDDLQSLGSVGVVATDIDGSSVTGTVNVEVSDDVATANADSDSVTEDGPLTADGNVITGVGGGTADVQGADDATVTGVVFGVAASASGNVGAPVAGTYGTLSIGAGGVYLYTLNNTLPAVQARDDTDPPLTETFTYTITDGDGDTSTTQVTISINGVNDAPTVINSHVWMSSDPTQQTASTPTYPDGYPLNVPIPTDVDVENLIVTANNAPTGVFYFNGASYVALTAGTVLYNPSLGVNFLDDLVYRPTATANDVVTLPLNLDVTDGTATVTQTVTIHEVAPTRLPGQNAQVGDGTNPLTSGNSQVAQFALTQEFADGLQGNLNIAIVDVFTDFQQNPIVVPIPIGERDPNGFAGGSAGSAREREVQVEVVINGNRFGIVEDDTSAALFEQSWFFDATTGLMKASVAYTSIFLLDPITGLATPVTLAQYLTLNPPQAGDLWTVTYVDNNGGNMQARLARFEFKYNDAGNPAITVNGDATLPDTIYGTSGNDTLNGNGGNDTIYGRGGNDTINGGDGDDILFGNDGDDTINGGPGTDTIDGGPGVNIITPPVVLDLDGDGLEFLSTSAGVRYDFDGDGVAEATAWTGADDGLLVYDANGDGRASGATEIVLTGYAAGASTDLEALRLSFDSDGDGKLTAADAKYASFGVWQDVDSDGQADAGEYRSLADLGIVSIDLSSDGAAYRAASGEVLVSGETSYARADGSEGIVGDVSFATSTSPLRAANDDQRAAAQSSAAQVVAAAVAAAGVSAAAATAPAFVSESPESQQAGSSVSAPAAADLEARDGTAATAAPASIDAALDAAEQAVSVGNHRFGEGKAVDAQDEALAAPADHQQAAEQAAPEAANAPAHADIGSLVEMSAIPVMAAPAEAANSAVAGDAQSQLSAVLSDALPAEAAAGGQIETVLDALPAADPLPDAGQPVADLAEWAPDWSMLAANQIFDASAAAHDAVMGTSHA